MATRAELLFILFACFLCSVNSSSGAKEFSYVLNGKEETCYEVIYKSTFIMNIREEEELIGGQIFLRSIEEVDSLDLCKKECCEDENCNTIDFQQHEEVKCFLLDCSVECTYSTGQRGKTVVTLSKTLQDIPLLINGDPTTTTESPTNVTETSQDLEDSVIITDIDEELSSVSTTQSTEPSSTSGTTSASVSSTTSVTSSASVSSTTSVSSSATTEKSETTSKTESTTQTDEESTTSKAPTSSSASEKSDNDVISTTTSSASTTSKAVDSTVEQESEGEKSDDIETEENIDGSSLDESLQVVANKTSEVLGASVQNDPLGKSSDDQSGSRGDRGPNGLAVTALVIGLIIIVAVAAISIVYFREQMKRKDYDRIDYINSGLDS